MTALHWFTETDLADWREGVPLADVPLIIDGGSPRRVNVSPDCDLPDRGLRDAIDPEATRRGMTRPAVLSRAARAEIRAIGPRRVG